ncbi:MAG: tyrosine decarboxylase MfnA [Halodesulfurarchaeum sp.]
MERATSRQPQSFDRVLSSMCTEPAPAARRAAEQYLASNPGDPATFRAVAELEREAVDLLGEVVGLETPHGYVTGGGTEANIQAVRAARNRSGAAEPNVVAPTSAHFSLSKAASLLDVDLRLVETGPDERADPAAMARAADDETALVFGVAGSTEYGRVDPIPSLSDLAESVGAALHVDAAYGGFLLPFTDREWNFEHARIDTMTIDPHKAGRAAIPAGGLLARERATLDALAVETPYLESESQVSLGGTRSGAGVASAHAALQSLWPDGYRAAFERTTELARRLVGALETRGFAVAEPTLPLVTWEAEPGLLEALSEAGWRLARTGSGAVRIVLMPHVTEPMLDSFLADIDRYRG